MVPASQVQVIEPVPAAAVNVSVLSRMSVETGAPGRVVIVITVGSVPEADATTVRVYFPLIVAGAPASALVLGQVPLDWKYSATPVLTEPAKDNPSAI